MKKTSREYDLIVIKSACQVSSMSVLWFLLSDLFIYFEFKNLGDNKQKTLVFSEKESLCDVDRKLLSKKKIAEKYGIPHNSLSTIIKNREKIESSSQDTSRKILRLAKKGNIDEAGKRCCR